jgi:hypothetical protein
MKHDMIGAIHIIFFKSTYFCINIICLGHTSKEIIWHYSVGQLFIVFSLGFTFCLSEAELISDLGADLPAAAFHFQQDLI